MNPQSAKNYLLAANGAPLGNKNATGPHVIRFHEGRWTTKSGDKGELDETKYRFVSKYDRNLKGHGLSDDEKDADTFTKEEADSIAAKHQAIADKRYSEMVKAKNKYAYSRLYRYVVVPKSKS